MKADKKRITAIAEGRTFLGIELGSTRIKAVLIDEDGKVLASGDHSWENSYIEGIWTYGTDEVWSGLQDCYAALAAEVSRRYGMVPEHFGAMGISAMMHGYMAFDSSDELLVPFRTWRNNLQAEASEALTELFTYPIPQRWSIAHLYQAIVNDEEHVKDIAHLTTLAGYVHWKLTGEKVLGVGEASGMLPIDLSTGKFNEKMIRLFNELVAERDYPWKLQDILPEVKTAGETGGHLSEAGALLLDPSGSLKEGIPFCPPEGDAGTGMVATNSIAPGTGNVSAGTSVFGMVVLDHDLRAVHPEIDQVTTPVGDLVAMAHANNCTSDLNAWVGLFGEVATAMGADFEIGELYDTLYNRSLEGRSDGGGMLAYGYLSGEHITGFEEGRPMVVRTPESSFNLANFMRTSLYTAFGALKIGMDILLKDEGVNLKILLGHGGLFKTEGVGQRYLAAAAGVPVAVMVNAGEGGPWGMALLAAYMVNSNGQSLATYLTDRIFADAKVSVISASEEEIEGFEKFMVRYREGLEIERAAVKHLS